MYWRQVVSHAPVKAESYGENAKFTEGFRIIHDQIDAGVSWSGHERNAAFLNLAHPTSQGNIPQFADVSAAIGFDFADDARALASMDWDDDGDLDVVITNRTGPRVRFLQNTLDGRGRFVTLRLKGTASNRDAIGARVTIKLRGKHRSTELMRTVYAGHGFISQSSKRIHFGLDAGATIESVSVRWPNGKTESINGVAADGHFSIIEGTGRANPVTMLIKPSTKLVAANLKHEKVTLADTAAITLIDPIPLPPLRYKQGDKEIVYSAPFKKPVLINLWATWCLPCVAELKDLAGHQKELTAAGIDVLALNLDELQPSSSQGGLTPKALLERIKFPFSSGVMTANQMQVFEAAHNAVFIRPHQLPIPLSMLVDRSGRISAVYRGPVSVDRLLRDAEALNRNDREQWRAYSEPFAGRWMSSPRQTPFLPIVAKLLEGELLQEASELLMLHPKVFQVEDDYPTMLMVCGTRALKAKKVQMAGAMLKRAIELQPTLAEAHNNLGMVYRRYGNRPLAMHHLHTAVVQKPDYVEARMNLASMLAEKGKHADALSHVTVALAIEPENRVALTFAGQLNIQLQQWERAKGLLQRVLVGAPNNVDALINLGGVSSKLNDLGKAIQYYEAALRINPQLIPVRKALETLYEQRKAG